METGLIFIEGARLMGEALRSELKVDEAFFSEDFLRGGNDRELAERVAVRAGEAFQISNKLARWLGDTHNSQGIFAIARRPIYDDREFGLASAKGGPGLFAYLFEINNPSNLGAILRTAEAAGLAGAIVGEGSADPYAPKSLRASMGSAFRLPIWDGAPFDEAVGWARNGRLVTTAADLSGGLSYTDLDWRIPRLVVFGSEAHGLSDERLAAMDETIKIPLENDVESLNLAVSAGVIFFEAVRQRRATHRTGVG